MGLYVPQIVLFPGRFSSVLVTAANTSSQGGGTIATDIFLAWTSGSNGSYVDKVRLIATASAAATATNATTARVFLSTQAAGATTSANTFLYKEVSLPIVTADATTTQVQEFDVPIGFRLPASMTILITNHIAPAANTAWRADVNGYDF